MEGSSLTCALLQLPQATRKRVVLPLSLCYSMRRSQSQAASAKAKAQKVMSVKRALPHCSQSAFTGMVRMAKDMDLSSFPSTRVTYRSFKALSLGDTPFGPMLVSVTLLAKLPYANKELHVVNPFSYLYTAHSTAGGFFDLIQAKVKSTPPSVEKPWRLVMYADEVVPGNQLATRHARKVWVIYFSFLELHPHLSNGNSAGAN